LASEARKKSKLTSVATSCSAKLLVVFIQRLATNVLLFDYNFSLFIILGRKNVMANKRREKK
jgi:hypothetical protein